MSFSATLKPLAFGMTIATLVLFPLVNALADHMGYWLHWRDQDAIETLGAWSLLSAIVFATTRLAARLDRRWLSEGVDAVWLLVGGFFFMGALVKTSAIGQLAAQHRGASAWIAVVLVGVFVAITGAAISRSTRKGGTPLRHATLMLSPLTLVFFVQLANAQWHHGNPSAQRIQAAGAGDVAPVKTGPRLLILLFDELSPDYLYGPQAAALDRLPALKQFVAESTVYPGAYLPGGETRLAIPALFEGRPSPPLVGTGQGISAQTGRAGNGWLAVALAHGLDVRVLGWHLDYCTGIAAAAHECRSVSLYNARTLGDGFSFVHPLWTTLNLLPADRPFGWAKERAAVEMHRRTYVQAEEWMQAHLDDDRADVIYVHVNVPHVPFIADDFVGPERFTVTTDRYLQQLRFVDRFLDAAMKSVGAGNTRQSRRAVLVVMSDHNVRALTPPSDHERIVFLVRAPDTKAPASDGRRINAADLLAGLTASSQ